MPRLTLSFISAFNERVDPLMNGTSKPRGSISSRPILIRRKRFGANSNSRSSTLPKCRCRHI